MARAAVLPRVRVADRRRGGVTFPGANGLAWPEVAAVGLCEGADGPVVAWTSHFVLAGETVPAVSPGSGIRITELRLTLFDRSRIVT